MPLVVLPHGVREDEPVQRVDDPDDPRVALYRSLTDAHLRRSIESANGIFIAEGKMVVRRLLASAYRTRSVLVAPNRVDALADVLAGVECPVYVAESAVLDAVAGFPIHRGVLACADRPPERLVPDLLATAVAKGARRLAVLEDVSDHENLGALVRSAAAFGIDALVLSPGCCDPLSRRALRVSMGAVLALPFARSRSWPDDLAAMAAIGFERWGLTPNADASPMESLTVPERVAVVLGAEGPGLSEAVLECVDRRVRITMHSGVGSLNVAAAAAIAFHFIAAVAPNAQSAMTEAQ
jgi:tRNA G18 (ribose-2'-O)-methylase SpoU